MKVCRRQFNVYFALIAALSLLCGCETDKDKNAQSRRLAHPHRNRADNTGSTQTISVLRSDPVVVTIAKEAVLTEANIVAAKVIEAPGGYAIEIQFDENGSWTLEQYSATNPGRHFVIFGQWGDKLSDGRWLAAPLITHRIGNGILSFTPDMSREEAEQLVLGLNNVAKKTPTPNEKPANDFFRRAPRRFVFRRFYFFCANLFAQSPFQFPTANHALYETGGELKFFAPTAPDKPWTSGSFGCVRDNGTRMHEGLDIRHLQTDKRGEPTDPVMATADGTVVYFNKRPSTLELRKLHRHPPCR